MLNLTNLTTVLQTKIDALTGTAEYKELLLLTKALEASAGRASVSDVLTAGAEQRVEIDLCSAANIDAINTAGAVKVNAINQAGATKVAEIGAMNVVQKTGGVMTGGLDTPVLTVTGSAPRTSHVETDGAADSKRYDVVADGGKLWHRAVNDAGNSSKTWLEINRTGVASVWSRYTAAVRTQIVALTDGATITPDFADGNVFAVTLAGNRALANPVNVPSDHQGGSIIIRQDATGSRTLSFGSAWKFVGGIVPALSATPNAVDRLFYLVVSPTEIHAALQRDFR